MIAFYISGHGFGHASRDIEVLNTLYRHQANLRVVLRTGVPAWLFQNAARQPLDVQPLETDSGLAQIDSLRIDERETIRRAIRFYDNFDERVAAEATWLRKNGVSLVVADVPPLPPGVVRLLPPEPWDAGSWGAWTAAVSAATGRRGRALFNAISRRP